jgi:dihydroneopterin aldolase
MALIAIEGMEFFAYHGVYEQERVNGGHYIVDVWMESDISKSAITDNINDTLNYEIVYNTSKEIMQKPINLIEKVCFDIHESLSNTFKNAQKIRVKVTKLNPPINGNVTKVSVEI